MPFIQGTQAKHLFRTWEVEVLDKHHESHPLLQQPRGRAALSMLAVYDSLSLIEMLYMAWKDFRGDHLPLGPGEAQRFKAFEEGLSQACRWLIGPADQLEDHFPLDNDIMEHAGDFLMTAARYVDVADQHIAYGRGVVDIEVDPEARIVRFVPPHAANDRRSTWPLEEQVLASKRLVDGMVGRLSNASFRELRDAVTRSSVAYSDGGLRVTSFDELWAACASEAAIALLPLDFPELSENASLGDFTLGELDRFWFAWRLWALCLNMHFVRLATSGVQQIEILPTQVDSLETLVTTLQRGSQLDRPVVESIVQTLMFDYRTQRPDIMQQPIVRIGERIVWSPRLVFSLRHRRNTLKLLARSGSDTVATLLGTYERPMLNMIGKKLSSHGYQWTLNKKVSNGSEQGEVDLLAWKSQRPEEVLIVEAKANLPPDEVNEIASVTKEAKYAQSQLERVKRILLTMDDAGRRRQFRFVQWNRVERMYGLVILRYGGPDSRYSHDEHPCINMDTLLGLYRSSDCRFPSRIWDAARYRRWLHHERTEREWDERQFGDVTYQLPMAVLSDHE